MDRADGAGRNRGRGFGVVRRRHSRSRSRQQLVWFSDPGDIDWRGHMGGGIIIATTNGSTWSEQSTPSDTGFLAVAPVNTSTAWAVGAGRCGNGSILATSNGGATWSQQLDQTPTNVDLEGVAAPDANHI